MKPRRLGFHIEPLMEKPFILLTLTKKLLLALSHKDFHIQVAFDLYRSQIHLTHVYRSITGSFRPILVRNSHIHVHIHIHIQIDFDLDRAQIHLDRSQFEFEHSHSRSHSHSDRF